MKKILAAILITVFVGIGGYWMYSRSSSDSVAPSSDSAIQERAAQDTIVYETDADSASDCSSFETFDPTDHVCRFECSTEKECADTQTQIDAELSGLSDNYTASSQSFNEHPPAAGSAVEAEYVVTPTEKISLTKGTHKAEHDAAWELFSKISPDEMTNAYVDTYDAVRNPADDTLAYVQNEGSGKFLFSINFGTYGTSGKRDDLLTVIHEFAHILTLNNTQVEDGSGACSTYDTGDGCTKAHAYLTDFVHSFWNTAFIAEATKGDTSQLYSEHQNSFVDEYAATSPEEDIAETFALFILDKKPVDDSSVAQQKIDFFYQYPEIVRMRETMRNTLSALVLARKRSK